MEVHERAKQRPPQPWAMRDRGVDVSDAGDPGLYEVERLLPQRRLQAVGDVARNLSAQMDRVLAHRAIEVQRSLDRVQRGLFAAAHRDEWNEVRRVERMAEHDALRVAPTCVLELANRDRRRARGQQRGGWRGLVEAAEEIPLDVEPLGPILLHEAGVGDRVFGCGDETEALHRRGGRQADLLHRPPLRIDGLAECPFCTRSRITRDDIHATREKSGCPARADDADPDYRDACDGSGHLEILGKGARVTAVSISDPPSAVLDFGCAPLQELAEPRLCGGITLRYARPSAPQANIPLPAHFRRCAAAPVSARNW